MQEGSARLPSPLRCPSPSDLLWECKGYQTALCKRSLVPLGALVSQRPVPVLSFCPLKQGGRTGLEPQNKVGGRAGWWGGDLKPEE